MKSFFVIALLLGLSGEARENVNLRHENYSGIYLFGSENKIEHFKGFIRRAFSTNLGAKVYTQLILKKPQIVLLPRSENERPTNEMVRFSRVDNPRGEGEHLVRQHLHESFGRETAPPEALVADKPLFFLLYDHNDSRTVFLENETAKLSVELVHTFYRRLLQVTLADSDLPNLTETLYQQTLQFKTELYESENPVEKIRYTLGERDKKDGLDSDKLSGHKLILIGETEKQIDVLARWLRAVRAVPYGKKLLESFDKKAHLPSYIQHDEMSVLRGAYQTFLPLPDHMDPETEKGRPSHIFINTEIDDIGSHYIYDFEGELFPFRMIHNLVHELSHAHHTIWGTLAYGAHELQAVIDTNQFRKQHGELLGRRFSLRERSNAVRGVYQCTLRAEDTKPHLYLGGVLKVENKGLSLAEKMIEMFYADNSIDNVCVPRSVRSCRISQREGTHTVFSEDFLLSTHSESRLAREQVGQLQTIGWCH